MADVISAVASTAVTNLGSKAFRELASAWHFKSELQRLEATMTRVTQVLLAHENGQLHDFEGLIERLKDAVYDADDLLDKLNTLAERKSLMVSPSHGVFRKEVRIFFSRHNRIANAFYVSREIKRIRKTLDDIVGDRESFPLLRREPVQPQRETCSSVVVEDVIGRDEEKMKILHVLLAHYGGDHVLFLPIVGSGGYGKTTLAQLAFNDKDVKRHFERREWVCVGHKFNEIDIIRRLVGSETNGSSLEEIYNKFRTEMEGKRYLFVLDDIWEEDPVQLLGLKSKLSVGATGSRVLVTTQSMDIANRIRNVSRLDLQLLSDEDSRKLFAKVAFGAEGNEEQEKDSCFVEMGNDIAKKCKNLPLVIKVIAGLLRGKNKEEWQDFKNNDLARIPDAADSILPLLKLGYSLLCPQLKQCFAYCSLLPKDCVIDRVTICQLWIAQGFMTSSSQESRMYLNDKANQCFNKLLNRSFFQDVVRDEWKEIQSVKMHDYLHDLAREVAGTVILRVAGGGDQTASVAIADRRHLCIDRRSLTSNLPSCVREGGNRLRTFLQVVDIFSKLNLGLKVSELISNFQYIRVLYLPSMNMKQLPDSIGTLIHLRYLDLSGNDFVKLPRTFTRLHNLETLNLSLCIHLKELPRNFGKLVNLQNLDLNFCNELAYMPPRMDNLTRLQRLTTFVVGFGELNQTGCCSKLPTITDASGLDDLSGLKNLRGHLDIRFKRNGNMNCVASTRTEANCLLYKSNLTELNINMKEDATSLSGDGSEDEEELLECLQPHSNIRSLRIASYGGQKFPSWMTMDDLCLRLPNLVEIYLLDCERCQHLPILSQLPRLKSLILSRLGNVEYIDESTASTSETFFPSLESLSLYDLRNVKGWRKPTAIETTKFGGYDEQHGVQPLALPSFHLLSNLSIKYCRNMTSMPLCPSLKVLELVGFSKNLRVMETGEWNSAGYSSNPPSSSSSSSKTLPTASTPSPLRCLTVDNIEYLNHLPKPCLHSLNRLFIERNEEANIFSRSFLQHLIGLENLSIRSSCKALGQEEVEEETDEMSWRSLGRLRRLEFSELQNLTKLPKWIEYLTNLQELIIRRCDDLVELPEGISQLSYLRRLQITDCKGLRELPQGIRHLTYLQYLSLLGCNGLVKGCRKPYGEDWRKIRHVPEIELPDGELLVHGRQLRMRAGG